MNTSTLFFPSNHGRLLLSLMSLLWQLIARTAYRCIWNVSPLTYASLFGVHRGKERR